MVALAATVLLLVMAMAVNLAVNGVGKAPLAVPLQALVVAALMAFSLVGQPARVAATRVATVACIIVAATLTFALGIRTEPLAAVGTGLAIGLIPALRHAYAEAMAVVDGVAAAHRNRVSPAENVSMAGRHMARHASQPPARPRRNR